jgi:hypothetical protein
MQSGSKPFGLWGITLSHFEIQNFQTILDGKMTKTKVVDLDENYKFLEDNFFI